MASRRPLTYFGYLSPIVGLGLVSLAALVDPQFNWESRSLSSIGEATGRSLFALGTADQIAFLLFNGGLIIAGGLALPFAYRLWAADDDRRPVYAYAVLVVALLSMAGIGIAYLDGPFDAIHLPLANLLFFSLTFTLWLFGTGRVLQGRERYGLAWIWIANAHAFAWVLWIIGEALVFTNDDYWTWFAVPEYVGAILFGAWILLQARIVETRSD
jgi:hypothetical membrane protein